MLIRNLAVAVTQKDVFDFYQKFGEIQKCKLECYADGLSRGYAYVQFANESNAVEAIAQTNGVEFHGKKLEVFAHIKRGDAAEESKINSGNNVFVKGFAKGTTEAQLAAIFKPLGEISNVMI